MARKTPTGRPVTQPPSKLVGALLAVDLANALDQFVAENGITKREVFERAIAREIGFDYEPRSSQQIQLPLKAG